MKTRAVPGLLKRINEREVLETIRAGAPISRAEISRRAGISKPTVSLALHSLLAPGSSARPSAAPDGPGYGAVYFEPVAEAALVLGLDLGARFVRGASATSEGRSARARTSSWRWRMPRARDRRDLAPARSLLETAALDACAPRRRRRRRSRRGRRRRDAQPRRERRRPRGSLASASELQAALDLPVTLENDINLAALGEQWQGVARGVDDFVFLSVGTGMGAGLVLGGELHRGRHGAAGELDFALAGSTRRSTRRAPQVAALADGLAGLSSRAARRLRRGSHRRSTRAPRGRRRDRATDRAPRRASRGSRRRRARRPRRRDRRQRRPAARRRSRGCCRVAALPAPGRGLDAGRGRRADRSDRGRARSGARERLRQASAGLTRRRFDAPRLSAGSTHLVHELRGHIARPLVVYTRARPKGFPTRPKRGVFEPRRRVPVLGPQPLDQLRRLGTRPWIRLSCPLAQRSGECVDLPHRRASVPHDSIEPEKV